MRTLYLDCSSGISGDMTVAALLDLGASQALLETGLAGLRLEGYRLEISRVEKNGINACDFHVILPPGVEEGTSDGGLPRRTWADVKELIIAAEITPKAKQLALRIFEVKANAEGKVHGLPPEEVDFHEQGAVDSIVDIVSAAILVDRLGIDRVICSPLLEGQGTMESRRGVIPIPSPATMEIARVHKIPLRMTTTPYELVTPTGAAIVAGLADGFVAPPEFAVVGVGYGAGKRDYPHTAGVLRAILLESGQASHSDTVCEITCNLEDMASEALAFACEEILAAGALDVWVTSATIKGKPGHLLGLLCPPDREAEFSLLLLKHTPTVSVRSNLLRRRSMENRRFVVRTPFGPVSINESSLEGFYKIKVDFESAKELAREKNVPINQILSAAYSALSQFYESRRN